MAVWAIVVIIILVVLALLLGGILYYQNQVQLQNSNQDNLIYPFTVQDGKSTKLSCPSGRVINVLDAWYELYDPNFQCTSSPYPCAPGVDSKGDPVFPNSECLQGSISTGTDPTMWWAEKGKGDNATYLALACQYDQYGMPSSDSTPCVSMNALGYLSNMVNGQNEATIEGGINAYFGPSPCADAVDPTSWPIGAQFNASQPGTDPNIQMDYSGYYGHGIYACVLEDEV